MTVNNKTILHVKKDKYNQWYNFSKGRFRLQLAGDPRKDGYWLKQYADKVLGEDGGNIFAAQLTRILKAMCEDDAEIFALYEMPEVLRYTTKEYKE